MSSAKSKTGAGKTVLITGGSGYVASDVLNAFLSRGYNVRATVRNLEAAEKVKRTHSKYINKLSFAIVKDLQIPGGHDEAVNGVDGVIHTASPYIVSVEDNEKDLLQPAINGTIEVLKSIQAHNPTVKRVVFTSSCGAVLDPSLGSRPGYTYTEKDWNPTPYEVAANKDTEGEVAYLAAKVFAEKAAFNFVQQNKPNFAITSLCPPMVYGPSSTFISGLDHLGTSAARIYCLIDGSKKSVPDTEYFGFVDVRDLGEAHARAYESDKAAGQRYLVPSSTYTFQQMCDIIREEFPEKRALVPEGTPNAPFPPVYKLDNTKIKTQLGMEFRDLRTMLRDMVGQFIEIEKQTSKA